MVAASTTLGFLGGADFMHGAAASDTLFSSASSSSQTAPPPLPLTFEQSAEGSGRFVLMAVLFPILIALLTPFWLILAKLASDPAARAVLMARPMLALHLGLAIVALGWIFGWPLVFLARGSFRRRLISIENGFVTASERGIFGIWSWIEPLPAYAGVTNRVRSSLSGVRHELVLVHATPEKSVILCSAPRISQEAVDSVSGLLGLAEIPSREAASFAPLHGFFHLAEPQPQLAAAQI